MLSRLPRLYRTIAPQRRAQLMDRLLRTLPSRMPHVDGEPRLARLADGPAFLPRAPSLIADDRIALFDRTRRLDAAASWNDPADARLWRYHLHYMDGLRAAATSDAIKRAHIARWLAENPPARGDGWDPYPISRRTVNWTVWAMAGGDAPPGLAASVTLQRAVLARRLERHLGANHLLANLKALAFMALAWREGDGCAAVAAFSDEASAQLLADGGHIERSPSYHALVLEDVLDVLNLARRAGVREQLAGLAARALGWLVAMTRPDGAWPLFNDAASGVAPTTAALLTYAAELGIAPAAVPLGASGYYRYDRPGWSAWIDAGPIGPDWNPGHGHADVFAFELFARGRAMIVDTGVSTYARGRTRDYERSTAAHNTVELAGRSQAELWGAFRVGRRPRVYDLEVNPTGLSAWHDGYRHLGTAHARAFAFAPDRLTIEDDLRRRYARADAVARLHFAPGVAVTLDRGAASAGGLQVRFIGADEVRLVPCEIADGFNRRAPALKLEARFAERLRTVITP